MLSSFSVFEHLPPSASLLSFCAVLTAHSFLPSPSPSHPIKCIYFARHDENERKPECFKEITQFFRCFSPSDPSFEMEKISQFCRAWKALSTGIEKNGKEVFSQIESTRKWEVMRRRWTNKLMNMVSQINNINDHWNVVRMHRYLHKINENIIIYHLMCETNSFCKRN